MMKKTLSILLAFSLVVQPAYGAIAPLKKVKEKFSAMREAVRRGNAVLKGNWQCLTTGKGEKCNSDKRLSLQIIHNFVTGKKDKVKEGLAVLLKKHWECWKPILIALIGVGVLSVAGLEILFIGTPLMTLIASLSAAKVYRLRHPKKEATKVHEGRTEKITRVLKNVGKCTLVVGIEIAIVVALVFIIDRMSYEHETLPSRINMIREDSGGTLLHRAFEGGGEVKPEEIEELLKRGADPNIVDKDGATPLYRAVLEGNVEVVELLLRNKANPNIAAKDGTTPLYRAVTEGVAEALLIAKSLLAGNANPNIADKKGNTPLHIAAQDEDAWLVELLLKHNADANRQNNEGKKPFELTANPKMKKMLQPKLKWQTREQIEKRSGS